MGYAAKLKSERIVEWKEWYIRYEYLVSLIGNEEVFIETFSREVEKIDEFFMYVERQILNSQVNMTSRGIDNERRDSMKYLSDSSASSSLCSSTSTIFDKIEDSDGGGSNLSVGDDGHDEGCLLYGSEGISGDVSIDVPERRTGNPRATSFIRRVLEAQKNKLFRGSVFREEKRDGIREKDFLSYISAIKSVIKYRDLNITGFVKVLKKYRRRVGKRNVVLLRRYLENSHFYKSKAMKQLSHEIYRKYQIMYYENDPDKARKIIKKINKGDKPDQLSMFLSGVIIALCAIAHVLIFTRKLRKDDNNVQFYRYYISISAVLFGSILFSGCLFILKEIRVNYNFIFGFREGSNLFKSRILFFSAVLLAIHQLSSYYLYRYINAFSSLIIIAIIFAPIDILFMTSRFFLVRTFSRIVLAPFFKVKFKDFLFADIFQSFSLSIKLLLLSIGIPYGVNTLMAYPSVIRALQCGRRFKDDHLRVHIFNGVKYSLTVTSVLIDILFSQLFTIRMIAKTVSSTYSLIWDIFFDWNLRGRKYLYPLFAYVIIVFYDLFARFIFLANLPDDVCIFVEVIRRFAWMLVRIEAEHLNNCDHLRAMKYVSPPVQEMFYRKDYKPLETDTESVLSMSDMEATVSESESNA